MNFWKKAQLAISDKYLRNKILFLLFAFALFRLLSTVPLPGVDTFTLTNFLENNQFLSLINIFSGGGLSALSIVMLGVGPYITASIIMQLTTVLSPRLKELYHHEGEIGRQKFAQYSRLLTLPIAAIQGVAFLVLLTQQGILPQLTVPETAVSVLIITAGAMLITWIGELMSEFGIGNGVSLLILAGIVAAMPGTIKQMIFLYDPTQLLTYIGFGIASIALVAGIVMVTEAERPLPVTYSKQVRGGNTYGGTSTYIPLRVNQAGVMPIIFALSILLFPQLLVGFLAQATSPFWQNLGNVFTTFLNSQFWYALVYFILVVAFTYFYTAITFEPDTMSENLQKNGAFIPGIRPGKTTSEYIGTIVSRITFVGAIFLGLVAVIPIIMQTITGNQTLAIGGTSLLIVVAVALDLFKRVEAQISMREY